MTARIYKPTKNAMQSGQGRSKEWLLEHEPASAREIDPLMGWTSSSDTQSQIHLRFETKEDAITYATRHGIPFAVQEPQVRKMRKKAYADNFKFGRKTAWTH
ncbi:MAG: hypothetical protein ACI89J_001218 [Hyphomicrobiaceae bacterium]|jgi:hypothetical protein